MVQHRLATPVKYSCRATSRDRVRDVVTEVWRVGCLHLWLARVRQPDDAGQGSDVLRCHFLWRRLGNALDLEGGWTYRLCLCSHRCYDQWQSLVVGVVTRTGQFQQEQGCRFPVSHLGDQFGVLDISRQDLWLGTSASWHAYLHLPEPAVSAGGSLCPDYAGLHQQCDAQPTDPQPCALSWGAVCGHSPVRVGGPASERVDVLGGGGQDDGLASLAAVRPASRLPGQQE